MTDHTPDAQPAPDASGWYYSAAYPDHPPRHLTDWAASQPGHGLSGPYATWALADHARRNDETAARLRAQLALRLSNRDGRILEEVGLERLRQDRKWGSQNHAPEDWLMILGEEVGEANKAALEAKHPQCGPATLADYRRELVEVAAVAVAAIRNHDERAAGVVSVPVYGLGDVTLPTTPEPAPEHERPAPPFAVVQEADAVTQGAAAFLAGLAHRMTSGEAVADHWQTVYESQPVGLSGEPQRTGQGTLTVSFTERYEADRYREAVAAAKPAQGVTLPPALFERLKMLAALRADKHGARQQCLYCQHEAPLGVQISHAPRCPGAALEELATLEAQG